MRLAGRGKGSWRRGVLAWCLLGGLVGLPEEGGLVGQEPADSYLDPGARHLLELARSARARQVAGVESYSATLTERVQAGVGGRLFRRGRTLLEQDRVARIRWSREGLHQVQWEGVRRSMVGISVAEEREGGTTVAVGAADSALRESLPGVLQWGPGSDRLVFGTDWALNPLVDSAGRHYRYASGDTVRVLLPGVPEPVELLELQVHPRSVAFHLVSASLWIHPPTGQVARAAYRPGRPFSLRLDGDGGDGVPGWFPDLQGEVRLLTVDYYLHDLAWWLPRTFRFQGEGRVGRSLRFPVAMEWSLTEYDVNGPELPIPPEGTELTGGARRVLHHRGRGEERHLAAVSYLPPLDSLQRHPGLPQGPLGVLGELELGALRDLEERLRSFVPAPLAFRPGFLPAIPDGAVRYNRVEGLAVAGGARMSLPLGWAAEGLLRVSWPESAVRGEGGVVRGLWLGGGEPGELRITGFRRLQGVSDWDDPFSPSASAAALVLGRDGVTYYQTQGAEVVLGQRLRRASWTLRGFREEHESVQRSTGFHFLSALDRSPFPENREVAPVRLAGAGWEVRGWWSTPGEALRLSGRSWGEVGRVDGGLGYRRMAGSGAVALDLPWETGLGIEGGGGRLWGGGEPLQRQFHLGGRETLRGFRRESLWGPSFWFARTELARGPRLARVVAFGDVAWAGEPDEWRSGPAGVAVGAGISLMDGLLRGEVARALRGGRGYRFHLYLDGIL